MPLLTGRLRMLAHSHGLVGCCAFSKGRKTRLNCSTEWFGCSSTLASRWSRVSVNAFDRRFQLQRYAVLLLHVVADPLGKIEYFVPCRAT